ncbi:cell wall hydrolase [Sporosalibacterium faouarense]|uniref:cell wall hydrolase n=1 Tax=Sporosalibacterium faouarense TaxID=516123 RepID=UPI00141CBC05|nr:cell wall hydrolase [Sporosalibacterium faouarense]MTI46899.1 cell wall hydrolase [Bacillota bacterium]MTI49893.1 cell wall hydrolase [Bacillota bacterium]
MAYSARELLARIIKCEAGGEGERGMKAVATTVMNRVHVPYGEYQRVGQGDLRKIIFQEGQFDCATSILGGRTNPQTIWASPPEGIHYEIADWALAGNKLYTLDETLWYFNPFIPTCQTYFPSEVGVIQNRIREHCFYDPTSYYAET